MRSRYTKFVLLVPGLLVLLATTTYPLVFALVTSFRDWRLNRGPLPRGWVGFDNYVRALTDDGFRNSVVVTLVFAALSVTMSLVLGMAIAMLLNKPGWRYTAVKSLLLFPFAISPALKGFSWRFMLNPKYGVYTYLIGTLIPSLKNFAWLSTPADALFWIAVSEVWGWAPLMALMFIGALGAISPEINEAANLDGANRWVLFRSITLPLLGPVLLIVTLLRTISSLKMFDQVVTLTGGGPGRSTQTLNYYVYQIGFRNLDMGYASALAVVLVLVLSLSLFAVAYVWLLMGIWCVANCVALHNEIFEEWVLYNNASMLLQMGFDLRQKAREIGNAANLDTLQDTRFGDVERLPGQGKPPHLPPHTGGGFEVEDFLRRAYHYIWNWRMLGRVDDAYAANLRFHGPTNRAYYGRGAYKSFILSLMAMFPDCALTVDDIYWMGNEREGFLSSTRWHLVGTHRGWGVYGVPTGRQIAMWGITQHRIAGGLITEEWMQFNEFEIMQQIYRD